MNDFKNGSKELPVHQFHYFLMALLSVCLVTVGTPGIAQEGKKPHSNNFKSFMKLATASEAGVNTVRLSMTREIKPLGHDDVRQAIITVDNTSQIVKQEETVVGGGHSVTVWTPKVTKAILYMRSSKANQATHEQVMVNDPTWPLSFPYGFLQARQWSCYQDYVNKGKLALRDLNFDQHSGTAVVELEAPAPVSNDIKITVDTRHSYRITDIIIKSRLSNLTVNSWSLTYGLPGIEGLIPTSIVQGNYVGTQIRSYTTYSMKLIEVNIPLKPGERTLGDYDLGSTVQDNRFTPPLVYIQGRKQYDDRQLFYLSKHRELLPTFAVSTVTSTPIGGSKKIILFVLSLVLVISGLLHFKYRMGSRSRLERSAGTE